ncbi:hypothetical protein JCM8097_008951 [Rhodosporidiobolus ruineniae]
MDRTSLADPNHRRQSYLTSPLSASSSQHSRRQRALDAQKERRVHAIEAARSGFRDLDDMEDLSLAGTDDDGDHDDEEPVPASLPAHSPLSLPVDGAPPPPVVSKQKRKAFKPRFKAWAKGLLSFPETMDLRHSLPEGFEDQWRAVVCPKGKRALCATTTDGTSGNTILYSRVAGRTLARFRTVLPADCLLDTVWDSNLSVLWVLDVMKWRGQFMVNCEADMRAFFIASKLSELETQPYIPSDVLASPSATASPRTPSSHPVLVLPVPSYAAPLTPSALLPVLSSLRAPSPMPALVYAPSPSPASPLPGSPAPAPSYAPITLQIPFRPDGLLLYLSASHYESGSTPLVGWVPLDVHEKENRGAEGVERLEGLLREWEARGGQAAVQGGVPDGREVSMDG